MLHKTFTKVLFFTLLLAILTFTNLNESIFYFKFFSMLNGYSSDMILSAVLGQFTYAFLLTVFMVTSLVLGYSAVYLDFYNNKKFVFLLICFFAAMITLSLSNSLPVLFTGWDGLGLSSIFLVMFYPNNNSLMNSLITMFFNRLGDLFLMAAAVMICFSNSSMMYTQLPNKNLILFLFMVCAMTKSAQFPLSSWLPAAMSAPTPISAMVHSSTLVTAGIFLVYKIMFQENFTFFISTFLSINILTMLSAGIIIMSNKDLKKVIAFSTMMQISLILSLAMYGLVLVSLTHLMLHAFFKSLMFICAGILFSSVLMEQKMMENNKMKTNALSSAMLLVTLFSISGLAFSCSFYSKGVSLEEIWCSSSNMGSVYFFLSSIFTILYSSKMTSLFSNFFFNKNSLVSKKSSNLYMFLVFSPLVIISPFWLTSMMQVDLTSILFKGDLMVFESIFLYFFIFSSYFIFPKIFLMKSGFFLKITSFNFTEKFMGASSKKIYFSEKLFFTKESVFKL